MLFDRISEINSFFFYFQKIIYDEAKAHKTAVRSALVERNEKSMGCHLKFYF